jgi:hypothetical protein
MKRTTIAMTGISAAAVISLGRYRVLRKRRDTGPQGRRRCHGCPRASGKQLLDLVHAQELSRQALRPEPRVTAYRSPCGRWASHPGRSRLGDHGWRLPGTISRPIQLPRLLPPHALARSPRGLGGVAP